MLGIFFGRIFYSIRSQNYKPVLGGCAVGIVLVSVWFFFALVSWNKPEFDASTFIIFGALGIAILASYYLLFWYLMERRRYLVRRTAA